MKKIYSSVKLILKILVFVICISKLSYGQYVVIPDSNFKNLLQSRYPGCISGNMLDTTCAAIVNETILECPAANIADLTGVQYFDNLITLNCEANDLLTIPPLPVTLEGLFCGQNMLTSLPALPSNLRFFYCGFNFYLTSIPALPSSLEVLACYYDSLTTLPSLPPNLRYLECGGNFLSTIPSIPSTVTTLYCYSNSLTSLPALPATLDTLDFSQNYFTSLPSIPVTVRSLGFGNNQIPSLPSLPPNLLALYCGPNEIPVLPTLPSSLQILSCEDLQITALPALPASLRRLTCSFNNITTLPSLPSGLQYLDCHNCSINTLPSLPSGLTEFNCHHNQLTSLPSLPTSLDYIYCYNNYLTSLPDLPDTLISLYIYNNPNINCLPEIKRILEFHWNNTGIQCLPNIISISSAYPSVSSLPLCQPSNGCPIFWNISGKVFLDDNGNCIQEIGDSVVNQIPVSLDSGNVQLQQMLTDAGGRYSFRTGLGTYNIKVDTSGAPFQVVCPSSFSMTSVLSLADNSDSLLNFALQCNPGYDLAARSISPNIVFRPALIRNLYLNAGDNMMISNVSCAEGVSGFVETILNGPVNYYSYLGLPPTSVNGDTITWSIADFSLVNPNTDFNIKVYADTLANIGDTICITLNVYPTTDNIPSNNSLTHCYPVVNSYDPNEKYMEPAGAVDTSTQWFTFTVFFQNTGNAPAEEIYLLDTLDNNLDATTFTYLSSSHNVITQLLPGNILRFNYPNINLPDSTNDEPNSHGYVQYKVKRKQGLPVNTVISNTAYIYFDFNPPVVTNTVSATLTLSLGIHQAQTSLVDFEIYPNPTKGEFKIKNVKCKMERVDIYSLLGEKVYSRVLNSQLSTVNCQLNAGIYFVKVTTENGVGVKRVVVE
jgi:uncharacterized repeat protein (TIGR01451 family)